MMKVLIADDDPVSLLYLQDALQEWDYEVVMTADGASALKALQQPDGPMLAIIDWTMPLLDGVDVCRAVRESIQDRYVYLIMLTAKTETASIVEAMNAGADDFVSKPFDADELQVRLRAGRRIIELEQELRRRATHDALTGVYNRGTIMDMLQKEMSRHQREQRAISVIFGDLDHFKRINDQFGHLAGDAVLREVTRRMADSLRPYDVLGRYGGEELLVVLPACNVTAALTVANRICMNVAASPIATDAGMIRTTMSMGVATIEPNQKVSFGAMLHAADCALYRAKDLGRNRVEMASSDEWDSAGAAG